MGNWIFVLTGTDEEFQRRIEMEKWPIFRKTTYRQQVHESDKVVFYKAGEGNKKFLGTSTVSSELKPEGKTDFFLNLKEIDVWKKSKPIRHMLDKLDFIKNKVQWGIYMQGGVRKLSEKDYELITK